MFTEEDYEALHALVFLPDYSGYKPSVVEIPNGDGKADADKKYAHVSPKYFSNPWQRAALAPYLERAHETALLMAAMSGVPADFMPDIRYGALRVLDYPTGAGSNRHQDFDLFTVMCYRDQPDLFQSDEVESGPCIEKMRKINQQAHLGELGTEIGLGPATPHWVLPGQSRQRSIVYFAIPNHEAILPSGVSVRDWLNERMARSRTKFDSYK
jgi:hypothetical protein